MPESKAPEAKAIARFLRVSPQKARLVVDLIRGLRAEDALHRLRFTRKRIAANVAKLLQSAIANATEKGEMDVDSLYVIRAFVNEGPRMKRIRPAPMGRAYHYQRRSAHIELAVGERVSRSSAQPTSLRSAKREAGAPAVAESPKPAPKKSAAAKTPTPRKPAAKKPAAKKPAAKKPAARKSTSSAKPKGGK